MLAAQDVVFHHNVAACHSLGNHTIELANHGCVEGVARHPGGKRRKVVTMGDADNHPLQLVSPRKLPDVKKRGTALVHAPEREQGSVATSVDERKNRHSVATDLNRNVVVDDACNCVVDIDGEQSSA